MCGSRPRGSKTSDSGTPLGSITREDVSSIPSMPSFADSIFLFVLALLLFGPKRLPVLARELGKWVGEFRRASNEFKMQMEDELRASEQADRQKQIVAMEAAAPIPPPIGEAEPEHPHLRHTASPAALPEPSLMPPETANAEPVAFAEPTAEPSPFAEPSPSANVTSAVHWASAETADGARPLPIAVSGDIRMMPPATGLPRPRNANGNNSGDENALGGLIDAIPTTPENAHHGD